MKIDEHEEKKYTEKKVGMLNPMRGKNEGMYPGGEGKTPVTTACSEGRLLRVKLTHGLSWRIEKKKLEEKRKYLRLFLRLTGTLANASTGTVGNLRISSRRHMPAPQLRSVITRGRTARWLGSNILLHRPILPGTREGVVPYYRGSSILHNTCTEGL